MAMTAVLALAALIGLTLGAVGGGGSILAVPALVGVVGLSVTEATTASLLVVGTASVIGLAAEFLRSAEGSAQRVKVGPGLVFGLTGLGGAMVGTHLNRSLDESILLIAFSVLMLVVAATMASKLLAGRREHQVASERGAASLARSMSTVGRPAEARTTRSGRVRNCRIVAGINTCQIVRLFAAGTAVGFLTGLFGVGGGFVIVPALMLVVSFDVRSAAATSLLVIAVNSALALALRADFGSIDWGIIGPFAIAASVGVLAGRRIADRVPARSLSAGLTALIAVLALWTAAQGLGIA
ncbi:MAG: sulfite exporter TauE/SafE family protein [Microthrixaceae bacterium]